LLVVETLERRGGMRFKWPTAYGVCLLRLPRPDGERNPFRQKTIDPAGGQMPPTGSVEARLKVRARDSFVVHNPQVTV
jgi:hypothetical protein